MVRINGDAFEKVVGRKRKLWEKRKDELFCVLSKACERVLGRDGKRESVVYFVGILVVDLNYLGLRVVRI